LRGLRIAAFRDQLEQLVCGSPVNHRGRLPAFCGPNRRPAACRPTPTGSNCSSRHGQKRPAAHQGRDRQIQDERT
jgi:hypothetical protein